MEKNYEISKELRTASVDFLKSYANYEACLKKLEDTEKTDFTEDEVNEILNLLGTFRLRDVFQVVERYKVEVTLLKSNKDEPENNVPEKAE